MKTQVRKSETGSHVIITIIIVVFHGSFYFVKAGTKNTRYSGHIYGWNQVTIAMIISTKQGPLFRPLTLWNLEALWSKFKSTILYLFNSLIHICSDSYGILLWKKRGCIGYNSWWRTWLPATVCATLTLVCQKQNNIFLGCFEVGREPSDETPSSKNKVKISPETDYCRYTISHEKWINKGWERVYPHLTGNNQPNGNDVIRPRLPVAPCLPPRRDYKQRTLPRRSFRDNPHLISIEVKMPLTDMWFVGMCHAQTSRFISFPIMFVNE